MWDSYVYLQGYYFTELRLFNITLSGRTFLYFKAVENVMPRFADLNA